MHYDPRFAEYVEGTSSNSLALFYLRITEFPSGREYTLHLSHSAKHIASNVTKLLKLVTRMGEKK
jgi:hypothetical protein